MSSTSVSGVKILEAHFGHFSILGFSVLGSMGTHSDSARIISSHFLQYQMGIGVAKILCREITQSQSRDSAQSIMRFFMYSGYHVISREFLVTSSVRMRVLMNHCFLSKISIGDLHLQHTPTSCWSSSVFSMRPSFCRSVATAFFASRVVSPAYFPAFLFILPVSSIVIMTGR